MLNSGDVVFVEFGCSVSPARLGEPVGNVGTAVLAQLREVIAVILDLPR
jgi:hypothetical protein